MNQPVDNTLGQLLTEVSGLFLRFGIKSLTMDDIARHLRMSKKTLYQCVSDKNDLVLKVVEFTQSQDKDEVCGFFESSGNAIDKLFEVSRMISLKFKNVHPSIFFDLQKYHPDAWNQIRSFKQEFVYGCLHTNTEEGKREGLYRPETDPDLTAKLWISRMDDMMNPDLYPADQYDFPVLHREMLIHHIRGIASEQGRAYLNQKIEQLNTK